MKEFWLYPEELRVGECNGQICVWEGALPAPGAWGLGSAEAPGEAEAPESKTQAFPVLPLGPPSFAPEKAHLGRPPGLLCCSWRLNQRLPFLADGGEDQGQAPSPLPGILDNS